MITRMDRDIGRILDTLKKTGQSENTLVLFSSDNGARPDSGKGGGKNDKMFQFFDSSGENRGIKRDVYNGGIREPFIAWYPGKILAGTESSHTSSFQDLLPTLCELLDIDTKNIKTDGISYLPTLLGKGKQETHKYLYWEFISMRKKKAGRQSVLDVEKNIKGVRFGRFDPIQIYDIIKDPLEQNNIAKKKPIIAKKLTKYLNECRSKSKLWPISMHDKGFK